MIACRRRYFRGRAIKSPTRRLSGTPASTSCYCAPMIWVFAPCLGGHTTVWPLCAHWRRPRSGDPCNCCNEFLPSHACPPEGSECVIVSVQTQHLKDTGDCVTQFVWRSPTSGQGQTQKSERATGQSRFTLKNRRRQPGLLGPKSANSGSCDVEAGRRLPRGRFCSRFKISAMATA